MHKTPSDWLPLQDILRNILLEHPEGVSEYELLSILQKAPYEIFNKEALQQPLVLFQTHFIVFNALYHIRDYWLTEQVGILKIDCLSICLNPWEAGETGLQTQDKLRLYYLNWQHLNDTNQQDVESLLSNFLQGLSGVCRDSANKMPDQQALDILALSTLGTQQELKKQYRRMLHKHHPDKGGDNGHTRLLHQAYESLKAKIKVNSD